MSGGGSDSGSLWEFDRPATPLAKIGNDVPSAESALLIHSLFHRDIEIVGAALAGSRDAELLGAWQRRIGVLLDVIESISSFGSSPFFVFGSGSLFSPSSSPFASPNSPLPRPASPFRSPSSPAPAVSLSFLLVFSALSLFRQVARALADDGQPPSASSNACGWTAALFRADSEYLERRVTADEQRTWLLACLLLASKVEEILFDYAHFRKAVRALFFGGATDPATEQRLQYCLHRVELYEQQILSLLNFDVAVKLPHLKLLKLLLRRRRQYTPPNSHSSSPSQSNQSSQTSSSQTSTQIPSSPTTTQIPSSQTSSSQTSTQISSSQTPSQIPSSQTSASLAPFVRSPSPSVLTMSAAEPLSRLPGVELALRLADLCVLYTNLCNVYTSAALAGTLLFHASDECSDEYLSGCQLTQTVFADITSHLHGLWQSLRHGFDDGGELLFTRRPPAGHAFCPAPGSCMRPPVTRCRLNSDYAAPTRIAAGSFGTVYSAVDVRTQRVVALKTLNATAGYGGFPYYMLREILFLRRLEHPNVVRGYGAVVDEHADCDGFPVFSVLMEYVERDLARVLHAQRVGTAAPFSVGQVKNLLDQLLAALEYLHELRILHRDLKPSNLLLSAAGVLKVGDLGSLRDMQRRTLTLTEDVTTVAYRSPELLLGFTRSYSASVDAWSVGCIFYELCTREQLFAGGNEQATALQIIERKGAPASYLLAYIADNGCLSYDARIAAAIHSCPPQSLKLGQLSAAGNALLESLLEWDPRLRLSCKSARAHAFFREEPATEPVSLVDLGCLQSDL